MCLYGLVACIPGDTHEVSRSAESSRPTLSVVLGQVVIKPRYPPHGSVPDRAVNEFATEVDSLFRNKRFDDLLGRRDDAVTLVNTISKRLDQDSQRALGMACMKIHGSTGLLQGAGAATDFLQEISQRWDEVWPASDSMGTELIVTLGNGYNAIGEMERAMRNYATAFERARTARDWMRAGAHGRALAYAYLRADQRDSARAAFARVIALHASSTSRDTNFWAGTLLASTEAEPDSFLIRLEQVRRLLPGVHNPQVISIYYSKRGQYLAGNSRTTAANTCFHQAVLALDTVRVKTIAQAEGLAVELHNTAYAFRNLGDSGRSEHYGTKAVALNEALMRSDDPLVARNARDRLAGTLEAMPLADSCNARYGVGPARQKSVLRLRSTLTPVHEALLAKTFANIAAEYYTWEPTSLDSISKYAQLCLDGPCGGETIRALQLLAFCQTMEGQHMASLETVRQACAIMADNDHFEWDSLERTSFPLSLWSIEGLGDLEEVLELLQRDVTSIRSARLLERLSARQSMMIDSLFMVEGIDLSKLIRSRELMTARLMRNAWPAPNEILRPGLADSVFAWMDDDKAMAFRRDRYLIRQAGRSELRALLSAAREQRESLAQQGATEIHPDVLRCSTRIDSIEAVLAQATVPASAPTHVDVGLAGELRARLDPGTTVIAYRLTKNDVFMACLDPDTVMLHRASRDADLNRALNALINGRSGIDSLSGLELSAKASLSNLIPEPFIRPGLKELVFLPSQELCYLPMETLPVDDDGTTVLDHCAVRYALSASTLLEEHAIPPLTAELDVFAFAPNYGSGTLLTSDEHVSRNMLMPSEQRGRSGPLLHNEDEVRSISSTVGSIPFLAGHADEEAFKTTLEQDGVLHLAMHAYSHAQPARSGLVFRASADGTADSRGNDPSDQEDGVFHAYELFTRPVKAPLVVLSACETGQGIHQDGEGVRSLARSFMLAGARSTVSSLWKVDDLATKEIMVKFYEKLAEGLGKADALAEAKRWYRRTYPNEPASKWAAFILIGDNEPVRLKKRSPIRPWMWGAGVLVVLAGGAFLWQRSRRAAA